MEARGTVHAVSVEQGHCGHFELSAYRDQFLGQGRAFEKAECGAGMKFDVHGNDVELRRCDLGSVALSKIPTSRAKNAGEMGHPGTAFYHRPVRGRGRPRDSRRDAGATRFQS